MNEFIKNFIDNLGPWFFSHGVKIILIIIGAYLIRKFVVVFIDKIIRKAITSNNFLSEVAEKKREDTLIKVFEGALKVIIWVAAAFMILSEIGIDIGPLLAGAGVIGLAVGFGAQYVIRDFFTGLFIILENQYRVGDVICIGGVCGMVESINLRVTVLRDTDGVVHNVPNGEIKVSSNKSKSFAMINLKLGISYDADLEKVIEVINNVGKEMIQDPEWKDKINEAPKFVRVDDFADSAVTIKIDGQTKPLEQWAVTGELRKRIKIAFDKEGIEIPFPQVVVHNAKD